MSRLKIHFTPRIKGTGVITFVGNRENQAVHWSLRGYNPDTQEIVDPVGTLSHARTKTDKTYCSTNVYICPEIDTGIYDLLKVEWND